jgi:flagellar M-ring protein FliF
VDGKRTKKYVPRSSEEIENIKNIVANAVGLDGSRGDLIEVSNVSFDTTDTGYGMIDVKKQMYIDYAFRFAKYFVALIIFILFYFLVFRKIMKKLAEVKETKYGTLAAVGGLGKQEGLDLLIGDEETRFPKTLEELEREIESELDESAPMDVDTVKTKVMLKKIEEAANEDPLVIANLIRAWMKDTGG